MVNLELYLFCRIIQNDIMILSDKDFPVNIDGLDKDILNGF